MAFPPLLPLNLSGGGGGLSRSDTDSSVFAPTANQSGGSLNIQREAKSMLEPFAANAGAFMPVLVLVVFIVAAVLIWRKS